MPDKEIITVVNPGREYFLKKLPSVLSYYASIGYLPESISLREIVLKKSEPADMKFFTSSDEKTSFGEALLICSCEGYYIYGIASDKADTAVNPVKPLLGLLLSAAAVMLLSMWRGTEGFLGVIRLIFLALGAVVFGYFAAKIVNIIKMNKKK